MADITSSIDAVLAQEEDGAVVTIYQPGGVEAYLAADGSPSTVTVLGRESKRVRAAQAENTKRIQKGLRRNGELGDSFIRENRVRTASAAVIDWSGWESDGAALPCTPENVRKILRADHILEQVEAGISSHADFFTKNFAD